MAGVNKVILIGNLGRDPEVRRTPTGTSVTSFSIATSEKFTDKSGNKQDKTEWHNIIMWGKLAEIAGQYLKKSKTIYVEGKLQTASWEKDGVKHYKTEVVASTMQMLSGADKSWNSGNSGSQDSFPDSNVNYDIPNDDDLPF